jgi:hypothetical protein
VCGATLRGDLAVRPSDCPFQTAKVQVGLDQHQVRRWNSTTGRGSGPRVSHISMAGWSRAGIGTRVSRQVEQRVSRSPSQSDSRMAGGAACGGRGNKIVTPNPLSSVATGASTL